MQAKDIKQGIEYAVLKPNVYRSRNRRNPETVTRGDVFKGRLVDSNKYKVDAYSQNVFTVGTKPALATAADGKAWGLLFEEVNGSGFLYVVKSADVVSEYAPLDARWAAQEAEAAALAKAQEEINAKRQEVFNLEKERLEKLQAYLLKSAQSLVPDITSIKLEMGMSVVGKPTGYIQMTADDFARLLESMHEAIENAA